MSHPHEILAGVQCQECGVVIPPSKATRKWCDGCRKVVKVRLQKRRRALRDARPRVCDDCGGPIEQPPGAGNVRKRCAACADARAKGILKQRRLAKRLPGSELVTVSYLYRRDGGRCGLCGKKVRMKPAGIDGRTYPDGPTIDHIVPLARGGGHTRANCQLAHHRCNMVKNARATGEQLRLVG